MIRHKKLKIRHAVSCSIIAIIGCIAQRFAVAATDNLSIPANNDIASSLASGSYATGTQGAPPFGSSVQLGNLGSAVAGLQDSDLAEILPVQGLAIIPSIGVQQEFTTTNYGYYSNTNLNNSSRRPSFVTILSPAILVNDQTRTVSAIVNYSPYIQLYDGRAYQDRIQQSLNAAVDAALVPGSINLALRGYITEQPTYGGLNPGGSQLLGPNNRTLTQSYSIEPSYRHFFDETGTLSVAYLLGITRQSGNNTFVPNNSLPYFTNANLLSQTESADFLTVPIFRRFEDRPSISASEDTGSGILNNAHQYFLSNTVRYAALYHVVLTGSGGYENIQYQGIPPVRIRDATWSVGIDYTPAENASFVARYQHLYGYNAPYMRVELPLTARTSLAASYSDQLTTPQQQIGANVANSSLNPFGLPVGVAGGSPVLLTNQTLGVQSNLQRQQTFSISTMTTYSRDSIGFSIIRAQDKVVAVSPGLGGFSQTSISGSVSYNHQLTDLSNISAYANYTKYQSLTAINQSPSTYAASINYTQELSPSLYGNAEYILSNQNFGGFGATNIQNTVIVGIQKTF